MALSPIVADVRQLVAGADGWVAYALVFVLAAIPLLEILLVVPPAIGFGLDPLLVGALAFLGNVLPIYLIVILHDRATAWLARRRGEDPSDASNASDDTASSRSVRASRILDRYGLGGLALAAPLVTGVHLATVVALLVGGSPRHVAGWMTVGIAVWTVAIVVASVTGGSLLGLV